MIANDGVRGSIRRRGCLLAEAYSRGTSLARMRLAAPRCSSSGTRKHVPTGRLHLTKSPSEMCHNDLENTRGQHESSAASLRTEIIAHSPCQRPVPLQHIEAPREPSVRQGKLHHPKSKTRGTNYIGMTVRCIAALQQKHSERRPFKVLFGARQGKHESQR